MWQGRGRLAQEVHSQVGVAHAGDSKPKQGEEEIPIETRAIGGVSDTEQVGGAQEAPSGVSEPAQEKEGHPSRRPAWYWMSDPKQGKDECLCSGLVQCEKLKPGWEFCMSEGLVAVM